MADARITHAAVEVLREGDPKVRITYAAVEVLRWNTSPFLRITHAAVEVLRANEDLASGIFLIFP